MDVGKVILYAVLFLGSVGIMIAAYVSYNKLTPEQRAAQEKAFKEKQAAFTDYTNADGQVQCPYCGSTQIQMVPRKWAPMMGFLTNKVDRVCLRCKKKF